MTLEPDTQRPWHDDLELLPRLHPAPRLALIGVAFVAVLGLDWVTGPWVSASIFYLLPVTLAALSFGRAAAIAAALASALAWLGVEVESLPIERAQVISAWNAAMRFGFFLIVAVLLTALMDRIRREKARADSDALTGLANRRAFEDRLRQEAARGSRYGHPLSLVYIDLDDFKAVNDQRGHAEGDAVLRAVADVLRRHCRVTDLPARLGGDEFAVLLPESDAEGAEVMVDKLLPGLRGAMAARGWGVGASAGIAVFRRVPEDLRDMLHIADEAMYAAKKAGKGRRTVRIWPV